MNSRPANTYVSENQDEQVDPLLKKVTETLLRTTPSQWKEFGSPLDPQAKYPKMVDRWEHIYVLEIKAGLLVLRSSTPVLGQFLNGGYGLSPTGRSSFTVELRDKTWDPLELTDIMRRNASGTNVVLKKFEVLVAGQAAERLFKSLCEQVKSFYHTRDKEFEALANSTLRAIDQMLAEGISTAWEKRSESGNAAIWYRAKIENVRIEVGRQFKRGDGAYRLILTNQEGLSRNYDSGIAQRLFDAIDTFDKNAGLMKLDDLLKDML